MDKWWAQFGMGPAQEFATDEESGEDVAPALCVGLKMSMDVQGAGSEPDQPDNERRERRQKKQDLETSNVVAVGVAKPKAPAMAFQVAKGLFNLHPLGVEQNDSGTAAKDVRKRGGEEPGLAVCAPIGRFIGAFRATIAWASDADLVCANEVELNAVATMPRQCHSADVSRLARRL